MLNSIEYKELMVNELIVDNNYHQNINRKRCEHMAENFIINLISPIDVVLRNDGKYYIIDGKHRVEVLKLKGVNKVMCTIHHGFNYEDECKLFIAINDPKNYNRNKERKIS